MRNDGGEVALPEEMGVEDDEGPGTSSSWARRVFLVDPPVARQHLGSVDSDIQNFHLVEGREVHVSELLRGKSSSDT